MKNIYFLMKHLIFFVKKNKTKIFYGNDERKRGRKLSQEYSRPALKPGWEMFPIWRTAVRGRGASRHHVEQLRPPLISLKLITTL